MKFLRLLDPYELKGKPLKVVGEQQRQASKSFSKLVEISNLHNWVHDSSWNNDLKCRLLVGLAVSYSLRDLRLADVINEQLNLDPTLCTVEVFNIDDIDKSVELNSYYGQSIEITTTPVVGLWRYGELVALEQGYMGVLLALRAVGLSDDPKTVLGNLDPPDPTMIYGS